MNKMIISVILQSSHATVYAVLDCHLLFTITKLFQLWLLWSLQFLRIILLGTYSTNILTPSYTLMTSIHIWIYVPLHFFLLTKFILKTLNLFHGSLVLILNRQFGLLCGGRRMEDKWFSNLLNGDQGFP